MRVGVLGGSFDPPHVGHALVAVWALLTRTVDEVVLVPVVAHPFGKRSAPYERRLAWTRALAGALGAGVTVSDVERTLPRPSYTIQTLEALAADRPADRFRLIVGADVVPDLPRWHRWEDLRARFDPLVVGRAGYPSPDGVPSFPEVSSTTIRDRILAGDPVDGLVPAAVLALLTAEDAAAWR